MYLSPVIYLFILCKFSETNKKINFKLNYFLVLIMFTFPIYKFSQNNFGINKFDSFPNIQKEYMKKISNGILIEKKYDSCKSYIRF